MGYEVARIQRLGQGGLGGLHCCGLWQHTTGRLGRVQAKSLRQRGGVAQRPVRQARALGRGAALRRTHQVGQERNLVVSGQAHKHLRAQVAVGVIRLVKVMHLGGRAGECAPPGGTCAAGTAQAGVGVDLGKAAGNRGFKCTHRRWALRVYAGCAGWVVRAWRVLRLHGAQPSAP